MKTIRFLMLAFIAVALTACKLETIAVEGGDIVSQSGTRNCAEGNNCVFEFGVEDLPYQLFFTAVPKPGYEFVKWNKGDNFSCGNLTNPTCMIQLGDDPIGLAAVASFTTQYIMPIYRYVGIDTDNDGIDDITDTDDDNDGIQDEEDIFPRDPNNAFRGFSFTDSRRGSGVMPFESNVTVEPQVFGAFARAWDGGSVSQTTEVQDVFILTGNPEIDATLDVTVRIEHEGNGTPCTAMFGFTNTGVSYEIFEEICNSEFSNGIWEFDVQLQTNTRYKIISSAEAFPNEGQLTEQSTEIAFLAVE